MFKNTVFFVFWIQLNDEIPFRFFCELKNEKDCMSTKFIGDVIITSI